MEPSWVTCGNRGFDFFIRILVELSSLQVAPYFTKHLTRIESVDMNIFETAFSRLKIVANSKMGQNTTGFLTIMTLWINKR